MSTAGDCFRFLTCLAGTSLDQARSPPEAGWGPEAPGLLRDIQLILVIFRQS